MKEKIRTCMYTAMKEKNQKDKMVYSSMLEAILKVEKEKKKELSNDEIVILIQKQIKQSKETLEFAKKNSNTAIIDKCNNEISLLTSFLPEMMTTEDVLSVIAGIRTKIEPIKANKGKYMRELSKLKGKADMKIVSQFVDELLS